MVSNIDIVMFRSFVFVLLMGCAIFCEKYIEDNSGCDCGKNTARTPENEKEGYRKIKNTRIVNGYVPDHRPWMAWIEICRTSRNCGRCGGSVLNHRWIISAAHCFCNFDDDCILKKKYGITYPKIKYSYDGKENAMFTAYVGLSDIAYKYKNHPSTVYKIKRVILHKSYRPKNLKHQHGDLALLRTYNKISFEESGFVHQGISPICLPKTKQFSEEIMHKYPNVYVAGWGTDKDPECNTNMYGPAPFTKCKFPFEYKGEKYDRCLYDETPAQYDTECEELKNSVRTFNKDFLSLNYSKIHVKDSNNQTITTCYPKHSSVLGIQLGRGWCATCIPSAKKPGDRGYCQKTPDDPLSLSDKYPSGVPPASSESYRKEVNVLENTTSPNWGICSEHCPITLRGYRSPLPDHLTEAELSLFNDSTCNDLLSNIKLGFNSSNELCAVKENRLKVRNFIKRTSGHNESNGKTFYQEADDDYHNVYGKVDSCFGDSGNNMFTKSTIS